MTRFQSEGSARSMGSTRVMPGTPRKSGSRTDRARRAPPPVRKGRAPETREVGRAARPGSVVAAQQVSDQEPHSERDRHGRSRVLANVLARVGPDVSVVLFEAPGRRFQVLAKILACVVELIARALVGLPQDLFGLVDLFLDEVPGAVKRCFLGHASPPVRNF